MSVITGVEITNFQSHRQTKLSFELGINAIVGPSNSGKSAILRAMEWCLLNTPSGTDFISVGADFAEVTIRLQNGYAVSRKRTRSNAVNTYTLLHKGEVLPDGVLTGFGSNVPPQVLDVFGMSRLEFGIAKQLEAPFLISETPKVRAETIGNLEELGKIDRALQGVNDDLRDNAKRQREMDVEVKKLTQESQRIEKELTHDRKVREAFEAKKHVHDNLEKVTSAMMPKLKRVEQLLSDLLEVTTHIHKAFCVKDAWNPRGMEVAQLADSAAASNVRIERIQTDYRNVTRVNGEAVRQLEEQLKQAQALNQNGNAAEASSTRVEGFLVRATSNQSNVRFVALSTEQAEESIKRYDQLVAHQKKNQAQQNELVNSDQERTKTLADMQRSVQQFIDALQDAKVCPLCEQGTVHVHSTI